ncbi:MAG: hypothetical protein ACPGVU_26875 [Limisphaerales bacterium]
MNLPDKLDKDFKLLCGHAPAIVVRALYNIDGKAGETWVAVGEERIVFYHRPAGGEFDRTRLKLNEVIEANVEATNELAVVSIRTATNHLQVKCSLFDLPNLDRAATACKTANERTPIEAPARLNSVSAFCAAIHAVMDADHRVDPVETEWLCQKLPDLVAIEQGSAWHRVHGTENLLKELPAALNYPQRLCLIANLIGSVMSDGLLEPAEHELVDRFRTALEIGEEEYDRLFQVILTRNQVAVLADEDDPDEEALALFAAALIAVTECDNERHVREVAYLNRVIDHPDLMSAAKAELDSVGVSGLLSGLPGPLHEAQRKCLLTNALSVAMVDGELEIPEQELIEQLRAAMGVPMLYYETALRALLVKNNLSVLS